jgi:hypothetical protein
MLIKDLPLAIGSHYNDLSGLQPAVVSNGVACEG